MGFARWTSTAAAFAIAIASSADLAFAQANVCADLETRLIQIERGGASAGDPRRYDQPIAQQRNEINRATAEARRAGCIGGFLIFRPTPEAKCAKRMATIDNMQNNLQRLMESRGDMGGDPWALARQRGEVLRGLADNRCGPTYVSNDGGYDAPRGGLFASLFGTSRVRTFDDGSGAGFSSSGGGYGTFRTLCVRTCDGFYFPISFSTVPSQFSTDQETCQAMCPGAEAVLYTHRNPGEDAGQMVSLAGEPYASLPTAFKFRQSYDKACTCRSANTAAGAGEGFTQFSTNGTLDAVTGEPLTIVSAPLPNLRPIRGEDPETIANRAGDFVPKPVTPEDPTDPATTVSADGQRKIRIVGPAYYYAQ